MRFFVTGVNGQLGHDVMNELKKRGYEAIGSDIQDYCNAGLPYISLDITDEKAVDKAICEIKSDAVIHCAAWTAVDMAEDDDKIDKVRSVNCRRNEKYCDCLQKNRLQNALSQHGLCL